MKVVIVGSGIVGASAAYHLSRKGVEVVVVDKQHKGQATAAGAGIVCPWISSVQDPSWYELAKRGALYYKELITNLKADGEENLAYRMVGALAVSKDEIELDAIEEGVRKKREGIPDVGEIRRLSPGQASKLFPPLQKDFSAVHVSGAARVDGRLLRDAMKNGAKKHGATFYEGEIARLETVDNKVVGVFVQDELVTADHIILASGAWTNELLRPYGVQVEVNPQRGQIAHLTLEGVDTSLWPVILPQSSHYLVAFDDSRVVVGATRETGSGFDYRLTASGVKEVLEEALTVAPGLSESTLKEVRIGFRPASPDYCPLLGSIPQLEQLTIATGLGASGLTMGPYVGTIAAQLALGETVEVELSPYNPLRKVVAI